MRIGKTQLRSLQKTYKSDSAIAAVYGITRQYVQKMRKEYGIPALPKDTSDRDARILAMKAKGRSVSKIAERLDLSETHIYRILSAASSASKKSE